jgi:putative ribosome biogenesis GTPase RsgA
MNPSLYNEDIIIKFFIVKKEMQKNLYSFLFVSSSRGITYVVLFNKTNNINYHVATSSSA